MFFGSDNTAPAHPRIIQALAAANSGYVPSYGEDALTQAACDKVREVLEAPKAAVYFVPTGSAANVLALSLHTQPWQTIFCSSVAHIHTDECGAPEFYTGGAKLTLLDHDQGKITVDGVRAAFDVIPKNDPHVVQPGSVSITNVTECGTLYQPEDVSGIANACVELGMPLHMDGARFANAIVSAGCSPAEMTWQAGVDMLSFGGTKNGLIGVEAVVLFDPEKAWELELRRKRGGHLLSKNRYLAAQFLAYLDSDLWLEMAADANRAAAYLEAGLADVSGVEVVYSVDANAVFINAPRSIHRKLTEGGAAYSVVGALDGDGDEILHARLMCSWCTTTDEIDQFLALLK